MKDDYQHFYANYLKNYHIVKANYLNKLIKEQVNLDKELKTTDKYWDISKNSRFILLADMRQNYFHAIETVFELIFALLPVKSKIPDNRLILKSLVKSNWRKNQKSIRAIANGAMKLNFLYDSFVKIDKYEIQTGHYLFYNGTYNKERIDKNYSKNLEISLKAIEKGLKKIAIDFTKNDEYNAYKHGIRIFPNFDKVAILDAENMKPVATWDLSDSMSFYLYDDINKKVILKTKLLDVQRDFSMTEFCSRLIYNIISLREVVYNDVKRNDEKIAVYMFKDEDINEYSKQNVSIQDLTIEEQRGGNS